MSENRQEPGLTPPSPEDAGSEHRAPSTQHRSSGPAAGAESEHSAPSTQHRTSESSRLGAPEHRAQSTEHYQEDDEISLLDIAIVLAKHKKLILGLPLLAAIITAGITLLMPNIYTGRAVIMPPQQQQSTAAAMLGQLGALSAVAGSSLGIKNPNDLYVGILKSRTIADGLIERFKLQDLYETQTLDDARKALAANTTVTAGRDGLIAIEVDDEDPRRAADMANAYVSELDKLTAGLAVTEAAQRRLFFGKQLKQAKEDLAQAEAALVQTQEKTGLIQMDEQGKAMIDAFASLKAKIAAKEIELVSMRSFATAGNPDYQRTEQELAGLRTQLQKMQRGPGHDPGDVFVPTGKIPAAGLQFVRKYREVKYQESILEVMAKQYELARIDEARDAAVIQVVDRAVPPERKSRPSRTFAVVLAAISAGFVSVLLAFALQSLERARREPSSSFIELRKSLRWR